jgi:DNA invertase Pin-like site-specific DNA recombinase
VRSDRPKLARLLNTLAPGITVIVTALDRLARSTLDLLNTIDVITKSGAQFRSLADVWCDTTTDHGKLMLTVLAGLAQFERSLIMKRTQAGITRANRNGGDSPPVIKRFLRGGNPRGAVGNVVPGR